MLVTPLDDLDMELLSIEGARLTTINIPEHLAELMELSQKCIGIGWVCLMARKRPLLCLNFEDLTLILQLNWTHQNCFQNQVAHTI
jgi:hypothetical protein